MKRIFLFGLALMFLMLSGCSGSGHNHFAENDNNGDSSRYIKGIAATGRAVTDWTIYLEDADGVRAQTTSASENADRPGYYEFNVTDMRAPFVVWFVLNDADEPVYSTSCGSDTVNINPVTNVVTRGIYAQTVGGTASQTPVASVLEGVDCALMEDQVETIIRPILNLYGVGEINSFISMDFQTDGFELDGVFDDFYILVDGSGNFTVGSKDAAADAPIFSIPVRDISSSSGQVEQTDMTEAVALRMLNSLADKLVFADFGMENTSEDNITGDLNLFTAWHNDTSAVWVSSNESIVSIDGSVTRPSVSTDVILTVTLSKNGYSAERSFNLNVAAVSNNNGGDVGGDTGGDVGGDTGGDVGGDTGGDVGGDTGGDVGGDTGGDVGGDTGGDVGGDTGGDSGNDTGYAHISGKADTLFIMEGGNIRAAGKNTIAQLGLGDEEARSTFAYVSHPDHLSWLMAAGSSYHSAAIDSEHKLYTWGQNDYGELGRDVGDVMCADLYKCGKTPGPVDDGGNVLWSYVATGYTSTAAIDEDGYLWTWGSDYGGVLGNGDGNTDNVAVPEQIGDKTWSTVDLGGSSAAAIDTDGKLYTWGSYRTGQLGMGELTADVSSPTEVTTPNGTVWTKVSVGIQHVAAIDGNGSLYTWGTNSYGQLGRDSSETCNNSNCSTTPAVVNNDIWLDAAAGNNFTLALKEDGTIWAWGQNITGQLGSVIMDTATPTQIGTDNDWVEVSAGGMSAMAVKSNGDVYVWGSNAFGQLGNGEASLDNITEPSKFEFTVDTSGSIMASPKVAVEANHLIMISDESKLYAIGSGQDGRLGLGSEAFFEIFMQEITGRTNWASVSAGYNYSAALDADGYLYTWGSDQYGQLGNGNLLYGSSTPAKIGDKVWSAVVAGYRHITGIDSSNKLYAWGYNGRGQLGLGDSTSRYEPTEVPSLSNVTSVGNGDNHTAAVADGKLYTWGVNSHGQLGNGTFASDNPAASTLSPEMRGAKTDWVSVAAGYKHTIAFDASGDLYSWGWNLYSQLGRDTSGEALCAGNAVCGKTIETVNLTNVVAVSAGYQHSAAIDSAGKLYTWGNNAYGQLGRDTGEVCLISEFNSMTQQWVDVEYPCGKTPGAVDTTDDADSDPDTDWVAVYAGYDSTVAVKADGSVWGFGRNSLGQVMPKGIAEPVSTGENINNTNQ